MTNKYTKNEIVKWHKNIIDLVQNELIYSEKERKVQMQWNLEVAKYLHNFFKQDT